MQIQDASELVVITIPAHNTLSVTNANGEELCHCNVTRSNDRQLDLSKKIPADAAFPVSVDFKESVEARDAAAEDME